MASAAGVQLSIPKSLRIRVNHSTNSKRHLLFKFFIQDGPIGPTVLYAVSKHEISRTQICRDTTIGCAKSSQLIPNANICFRGKDCFSFRYAC